MERIIDKFLQAQNKLVLQASDLSLESISNMVAGNAIEISPKYQRRERWTSEKQSALIESFLLNIPVPPIYLSEDEFGRYSVIDGKQRITSIYNFIHENHKLNGLENFKELEGLTFNELPTQLNNALRIRPYLRVITLLKQSDPTLKYEVFTRLNTGGEPLLPQEVRNVAFRGDYNDMIFTLSENSFLREQLKIKDTKSKAYREMLDAEYVLRFFTLIETWNNFPGNMRNAMDDHMLKYAGSNSTLIKNRNKLFNESLNFANQIWGKDAFKRPENKSYRNQILQGIYDVQTVPFALLKPKQKKLIPKKINYIKKKFEELYEKDNSFQESMRQFTSNKDRVYYRIHEMNNLLNSVLR